MQTNSVTGGYTANAMDNAATTQTTTTAAKDTTNFMQMLMAQLTHQNPMEPMNDAEMMGQMAQLNSLQELQTIKLAIQEMASANQTSYAASLIGKVVKIELEDETVEGQVTGVSMEGGKVYVQVGEKSYELGDVREISAEESNG